MKLISLNVPEAHLDAIDELVRQKIYPNRSEAIRTAICEMVREHKASPKIKVSEQAEVDIRKPPESLLKKRGR